jgi:hypothetical protein
LEEELFELDLIYGDDCDYEAYNYFISDNEDEVAETEDEMPPLEPWTPTKK